MEINRVRGLAQFNRVNGAFITVIGEVEDPSMLNHDQYLYHEVEIDDEHEQVVGNYNSFEVKLISELPLEVNEDELNQMARDKIISEYPIERQLTVIGDLLEKLAASAGVEAEDLHEMNDYIREVKRVNKLRKEFYASDPDYQYLSSAELEARFAAMQEGGIAEYEQRVRTL